jgi:hypothetical protein
MSVEYNYLNLPSTVYLPNGSINFTYDAGGKKLAKEVLGTNESYIRQYAGIGEFKNGVVEALYHSEGRLTPKQNEPGWHYEYVIRDHLGSGRVFFEDKDGNGQVTYDEIIQESHTYPFGMAYEGPFKQPAANGHAFNIANIDGSVKVFDGQLGREIPLDQLTGYFRQANPNNTSFTFFNTTGK